MSSQCTVIVYISLRNFVGEGIIRLHKLYNQISRLNWSELEKNTIHIVSMTSGQKLVEISYCDAY
jgi:hypothetical protein